MPIVERRLGIRAREKPWGYQEVGFKYQTGKWYVTETDADTFCGVTGLRQSMFLDDDAAAELGKIGEKGRFLPGAFEMGMNEKGDKYLISYNWSMRNQDDVVIGEGEAACLAPNPEWKG
ncbi:hypothetical protein ES703_93217 [subsurface metagenome]